MTPCDECLVKIMCIQRVKRKGFLSDTECDKMMKWITTGAFGHKLVEIKKVLKMEESKDDTMY